MKVSMRAAAAALVKAAKSGRLIHEGKCPWWVGQRGGSISVIVAGSDERCTCGIAAVEALFKRNSSERQEELTLEPIFGWWDALNEMRDAWEACKVIDKDGIEVAPDPPNDAYRTYAAACNRADQALRALRNG